MAYRKYELRSSLTQVIPLILTTHYQSAVNRNAVFAEFLETYKETLDFTFTTTLTRMVEALFMGPIEYKEYLNYLEKKGIEQGEYTADIYSDQFEILLEMSKDLNLTAQRTMFRIIEENVDHAEDRLFFHDRIMECNWTCFAGFAQGYLSNKKVEIDSLHEQKIAVMGQMAAGMAHEIRNPLSSIKGFAQLVNHRLAEPELKVNELRAYMDITIKEIDALNGLVTDFLILSRKGDAAQKEGTVFNVMEVIHRVNHIVNQLILSDDITLSLEYYQDEIRSFGRASQLEQVFLNILKNSIDSFEGGRGQIDIAVAAVPDPGEIVLSFKDNGAGIPKDKLSSIFDPFFTTKPKGTGIGLSICKQLIEMYGGRIRIDSEVQAGTTVSVTLPWVRE